MNANLGDARLPDLLCWVPLELDVCQHLRNIAMPFLPSLIDRNSKPFSKIIPNGKITQIYVWNSPIETASATAMVCRLYTLLHNVLVGHSRALR